MDISKQLLSLIFILLPWALYSQNDNRIDLNFDNNKMVIAEQDVVDSLGYDFSYEDTEETFENIPYTGPEIHFIYFEWMSGYGLYGSFDITATHYKHCGSVKADTIILGKYAHPAPFKVTSNYGKRRRRMHYGVDLGYPTGTPVVAAFDGIVRCSKAKAGGYGQLIVLRHDNGLETYYGHLSKRLVNPGQVVRAGDTIGLGGNTGRSYGSHLHFETRYLGTPFNPNKIIDFTHQKLACDTLYISGCEAPNIAANTSTNSDPKSAGKAVTSTGTSSSAPVYYRVKNGDTLSHIAARYGTSVTKIKKLNGLKSDFLSIGQRLRIR